MHPKEIIIAKKEPLAIASNAKEPARNFAKESQAMRSLRIDDSSNGATLRTRVIKNKKLYNRNIKHKKSFANAGDFPFHRFHVPKHTGLLHHAAPSFSYHKVKIQKILFIFGNGRLHGLDRSAPGYACIANFCVVLILDFSAKQFLEMPFRLSKVEFVTDQFHVKTALEGVIQGEHVLVAGQCVNDKIPPTR